ncbi:MAG: 50S ribosomal protein L10 [Planctomycetota bacterium]|nr:50S ribosomal protein L10 [Planctomycetota bacterium]
MSKQLKTLIREALEVKFEGVEGGVLINTQALNSEQTYAFRKALHARKLKYTVLRNAIAARTFVDKGYKQGELDKVLKGPVGLVYSRDEGGAILAAKTVFEWKKDTRDKVVEWKGAFVDGQVLNAKDAEALRNAPGKQEVRAMLAGALQAPIVKLAATFKEMYARFAYAINALEEKRGGKGDAAPAEGGAA